MNPSTKIGPSYQYAATMDRVIDGDTFAVTVDLGFNILHKIHVRLKDIDTPEISTKNQAEKEHGIAAREFVKELLPPGTKVVLSTAKSVIYNRWEADVFYDMLIPSIISDQEAMHIQASLKDVLKDAGFEKEKFYPENHPTNSI